MNVAGSCRSIGFVRNASSIDDLAETTASNGGTHYRVLDDNGGDVVVTDFGRNTAVSRTVKAHRFVAEAYLCR